MTRPEKSYTINDVKEVERRGPWHSKSGGTLEVLFALPRDEVAAFLDYDNPEFDALEEQTGINIRGLRSYTVSDIPKGSIGGGEWHRARTEYVGALGGAVLWQCVDSQGNEREYVLDGSKALIQPPGIMHSYEALKDNTTLQVVCNTLFIPEDPSTHDTFSREAFDELR